MKQIKFDIKFRPEIESGKYKLMCDGCPVEILKWDRHSLSGDCIVGLVNSVAEEHIYTWNKNGEYNTNSEFNLKLYSDEPELNEFEVAVKNAMLAWSDPTEYTLDDDFVREEAKKPYQIAFSECEKSILRRLSLCVNHTEDTDYESLVSLHANIDALIRKYGKL